MEVPALVPVAVTESPARAGVLMLFGVLGALLFYVQYLKANALYGGSERAQQQTNCDACGVRIPVEAETCGYCGEPTADEERSRGW